MVKVAKAKKYEELPEIPDYERPELEKYEASDFSLSQAAEKTKLQRPQKVSITSAEQPQDAIEEPVNGLPKVRHFAIY